MSQTPFFDDERTVTREPNLRGSRTPFLGRASFGHTLPEGSTVGGLQIVRLIGEGGFGIVYLAHDPALQRQVAVKEYMPSSLATRVNGGPHIAVKSERHADTFKAGLRSFVNEARLLARFDHPSLVKVYSFWEANSTAYMAMPYYEGPTLKRALTQMRHPPDEATLRAWLHPLLDALSVMHREQCFHRDIAPDNILLTPKGPLLLDLGAARHVIGDMTHALTAVLKPGYAPIEQYGEMSTLSQGAWTDLYALACVVYYAISGNPPMSSVDRLMAERLVPLSRLAAGRYGAGFLHAIDAALSVRPQDRPQDVAQFRALLDTGMPQAASDSIAATPIPPPVIDGSMAKPIAQPFRRPALYALGAATFVAAAAGLAMFVKPRPAPLPELVLPATSAVAPAAAITPTTAPAPSASTPVPAVSNTDVGQAILAGSSPSDAAISAPPTVEPIETAPAAHADRPLADASPAPRPKSEQKQIRHATRVAPPAPPPDNLGGKPVRCSDILQKASLETLSPEEAAYLRTECR